MLDSETNSLLQIELNTISSSFWKQACELAPIFNELVDRVSLDGEFLQAALSRQVLNYILNYFDIDVYLCVWLAQRS